MRIAVKTNSRTALAAMDAKDEQSKWMDAFGMAFKGGSVMGFSLVGIAVLNLYILIQLYKLKFSTGDDGATKSGQALYNTQQLYDAIAAYGLGGSAVALFGRVGGGIYTKAADVGADLCGKVENDLAEDSPMNPATIADNVGDNVGDIAGMGADLFGSFAESTCAALVISSTITANQAFNYLNPATLPNSTSVRADLHYLNQYESAMFYPLLITATGIIVCLLTHFVATDLMPVKKQDEVEPALKMQLLVSTVLATPTIVAISYICLPTEFQMSFALLPVGDLDPANQLYGEQTVQWWHMAVCCCMGLWSGLIIGYTTEYYTSFSYNPVQEVSYSCVYGAATNVIYGLALGYLSVIIPIFCLAVTILVSFKLAFAYGAAVAALGILSTLPTGLTIDAYGPISDNAGGIAEMSEMGDEIRKVTDALDAAGNTTAAIGKGFAIGSAALVSLALFGAFTVRAAVVISGTKAIQAKDLVNVFDPWVFFGLIIGSMLPYWFSAMTMKSVGFAAQEMVKEVRRQITLKPGILKREVPPDYNQCVAISTEASLKEMIAPGLLVMGSPLIMGFLFGVKALSGLLAGGLVSGVQLAISMSNTGGAWDNAKKYVEGGHMAIKETDKDGKIKLIAGKDGQVKYKKGEDGKEFPVYSKGTDVHKAAVTGDTVGDPLKDTSGPSLNILMKLMAIISVVFAPAFAGTGCGAGLIGNLVEKISCPKS